MQVEWVSMDIFCFLFFPGDLATRDAQRVQSDDARVQEASEQARLAEERFTKMKGAYEKFRMEHVAVGDFLPSTGGREERCFHLMYF